MSLADGGVILKHDGVYAEIKPDLLNEPRLNWLDY